MNIRFDTKEIKCIEKLLRSDVRENNLNAAGVIIYRVFTANTQEQENHKINKGEILFDLVGNNYKLKDTAFLKSLIDISKTILQKQKLLLSIQM